MENIDMVAKQMSDSVAMVVNMLDDFESKIPFPLPTGTSVS